MIFRDKTGVSLEKMCIYVCTFLLSLVDYCIYHSNEKQLQCAGLCLTTGLNRFPDGVSLHGMGPVGNFKNKLSKLTVD